MMKIVYRIVCAYEQLMSRIHTFLILLVGKKISIGKGTVVFYKSPIMNVSNLGGVKIGENCYVGRSEKGYHAGMPFYTSLFNDGDNSGIIVGNNCRINGAYIHAKEKITIGNNCVIASGVSIIDSNGHQVCSSNRTVGRDIAKPIVIGDNVWIGINSIILKGTTIGDNSIVSAGSVCKGAYPKNSIISGNPANVIKKIDIPLDN